MRILNKYLKYLIFAFKVIVEIFSNFLNHNGFANASMLSMASITAIFPFFILLVNLAAFIDNGKISNFISYRLPDLLPKAIVGQISEAIITTLNRSPGSLFTVGSIVLLFTISSCVESLRYSMNDAYHRVDRRPFYITRLWSLLFVAYFVMIFILLMLLFIVFPATWALLLKIFPGLIVYYQLYIWVRWFFMLFVLIIFLFSTHMFLPYGGVKIRDAIPGVLFTLILWWISSKLFSWYLDIYAPYSKVYAGLSSAMGVLLYFYLINIILLLGAEYNSYILYNRAACRSKEPLYFLLKYKEK